MKDLPEDKNQKSIDLINLLNTNVDVSSGMHMPSGSNMWSSPTINTDINLNEDLEAEEGKTTEEEEKILKKEALGLLDIPTSLEGGEILDFKGTPQNLGLGRNNGEDEETDYFGAATDVTDSSPDWPQYYSEKIENTDEEINNIDDQFINFLYKKEINAFLNNLHFFEKRWGEQKIMRTELEALEGFLKKQAGVSGGLTGMTAGILSGLLPGISFIPTPIRAMVGGIAGSAIEDYFENRPKEKMQIQQQASQVESLKVNLMNYGVTESELNQLSEHTITPETLIDAMKARGARMPSSWVMPLQKLSQQYVSASDRLHGLFQQAYNSSVPKIDESSIKADPIRTPEAFSARGNISRPGDPYTYNKDLTGESYVVVSAPPGKENVIGRKIMPGDPGYDLIRAADPSFTRPISLNPKEVAADEIRKGLDAVSKKDYQTAILAFQKSLDSFPTSNALFNLGKAQFDSGDASSAIDTFQKYKNQYPDDWVKNQGLLSPEIQSLLSKPISLEEPVSKPLPENYSATKDRVVSVLTSFLQGVPIRVQTAEGTSTVMDSGKVRSLTESYIRGISGFKRPEDGISLTATGLSTEFRSAIELGMKQVMDKGVADSKQLDGVFHGLVWQALRKGWAKWKNAPLKDHPTEGSEERRTKQLERQDVRLKNQAERKVRRENAKREARKMIVEGMIKTAK